MTLLGSAYIEYDAVKLVGGSSGAAIKCRWCGTLETYRLGFDTIPMKCPNCGGPR